jgi:hypothetical protein
MGHHHQHLPARLLVVVKDKAVLVAIMTLIAVVQEQD